MDWLHLDLKKHLAKQVGYHSKCFLAKRVHRLSCRLGGNARAGVRLPDRDRWAMSPSFDYALSLTVVVFGREAMLPSR